MTLSDYEQGVVADALTVYLARCWAKDQKLNIDDEEQLLFNYLSAREYRATTTGNRNEKNH